jgi:aerobic carbon-monoxide dehydrogenase medium subunit
MAMRPFAYHRPADVAAALALLRAEADARYLAGGQSLLGAMKLGLSAPTGLIDVVRLPALQGIERSAGAIRIGAATTHAAVARSPLVREAIPALAHLADQIGDPAVRAWGTLGGSVANADPAACYPAALLGLAATVHTDRRAIDADAFFLGIYQTALEPDELITAVEFPTGARAAWAKFKHPASRFALVGVFVARAAGGAVRVAVTGAGPCAFRVTALEAALERGFAAAACDDVPIDSTGLTSDLHAQAAYRAHLISVLARRAVTEIVQ